VGVIHIHGNWCLVDTTLTWNRMEPHYSYDHKGDQTFYYTYDSNPGGRDGSSGRPGRSSNASLFPGNNGSNGAVNIFVKRIGRQIPDGPYPSTYSLEVTSFDIVDGNDDGILEFGDEISLENISVRNSGTLQFPRV